MGYVNVKTGDGRASIEFDPERAEIVKRLFEEYATTNHSLESITIFAKELGLIARDRRKKKSKCISRNGIYHVLKNPFYFGLMRVKGKLLPHVHPKLIDKSLFDRVQDKLSGNNVVRGRNPYSSIPFAFRGLVRCSTCGSVITPETHTKKSGKQYTYLKCSHVKGNCKQGIVNENILLEQLDNEIFKNI